eukprot:13462696-Alexandrium_andersonii.AAC.1
MSIDPAKLVDDYGLAKDSFDFDTSEGAKAATVHKNLYYLTCVHGLLRDLQPGETRAAAVDAAAQAAARYKVEHSPKLTMLMAQNQGEPGEATG